jgi:glutaredoxin
MIPCHETVGNGRSGGKMKAQKVRLFIKPYCGWCHEAIDWLNERAIKYETLDVTNDAAARREMLQLSGQIRAPVIEVDGEILADFGAEELEEFWSGLHQEQK